jgi:hypothetical protein
VKISRIETIPIQVPISRERAIVGGRGATRQHHAPAGGKTFSVGSITWIASLLVDQGTSRITANVLRRCLSGS